MSVVVVNHNGKRYLDTCLPALLAQQVPGGHEVILVDNASTDDSSTYVRARWPEVRVVDSGANLGFAGGNNLGIAKSRGEHVVLINNDTRARPGYLAALVAAAESAEGTGAVTPKLVFMDRPQVIQNAGTLLLSDGSGADRGSGRPDGEAFGQREEVFGFCGCGALLSRRMLADVGAFDEDFWMYYEDTDLSWRMRLRGWRVLYEPGAVVDHVHAGTSVEWSPIFTFHVDRNRLFMIVKNAPTAFVLRSFWSFGWLALRAAVRALLRPPTAAGSASGAPRLGGRARAAVQLRALGSLLRHLPALLVRRRRIRGRRRVSDAEIRRWLYSRQKWQAEQAAR